MNKRQCCIRNFEHYPVPGGWGMTYELNGQNFQISNVNPTRVVAAIAKIQKNNNAYHGDDDIWDYCNDVWARRAPQRVRREFQHLREIVDTPPEVAPAVPKTDHWKTDPAYFGPILWFWLHFFGHSFDKAAWDSTIARISLILDPVLSPDSGCPTCHQEWQRILQVMPPDVVTNEAGAARWSFDAHNAVNKKLGKPIRGWSQAAKLFAWKVTL